MRILQYLDPKVILENPKIILGMSDSSTFITQINRMGLVTSYGPTVMVGLAQMESLPKEFERMFRAILFEPAETYTYKAYPFYTDGYPDWSYKTNTGKIKAKHRNEGWHWLQGDSVVRGKLFGGCADALEFMKGTDF